MTSGMPELETRRSQLKSLAGRLAAEQRWLSTPLDAEAEHVKSAQACRTPIVSPLTIGTLLASVLGEIDSVECAISSLKRREHPGED